MSDGSTSGDNNRVSAKRQSVVEKLEPMLMPVAESQGVALYALEYLKEGADWILRIYIDKEGGVDINDCERVSHAAEAVLDKHDPLPSAYILEVSSPGIERKLTKDAHYARYAGERVEIRLFKPIDGKRKYRGLLKGLNEDAVVVEVDGADLRFERAQISVCRLSVFDN